MGGMSALRRLGLAHRRSRGPLVTALVTLGLTTSLALAGTARAEPLESPSIAGATRAGQTLTVNHGTWSGAEPFTYSYQWYRCDSEGGECAELAGQTGNTYALIAADVGHKIKALVSASNEEGTEEAGTSATAAIAPGTSTAGLADQTQSLLILPSYDPVESSNLNLEGQAPVFVVQSMPKPMTVSAVTIGDFARASGCESNANVELDVYSFAPSGNLSSGTLIARSSDPRPFGSNAGEVTWQIPTTELALHATYGFFIKATSGPCHDAIERSWAHNGTQVNGGSAACSVLLGSSGYWRLWHTESHADAGECQAIGSLSNFSSSLPTGWTQVNQSGEAFSVNTTPEECATGLGASETPFGSEQVACRFPQFTKPNETTPDGWYYGLPWEGPGLSGSPRDLYFRLDSAPPPAGRVISPPAHLSSTAATLEAVIKPKGRDTQYQFHWTRTGASGDLPEHPADAGSSTGDVTVSQRLEGLKASTSYHYYLTLYTPNDPPIDKKLDAEAYSGTFTTPAEPEEPLATTGAASEVGVTLAKLEGSVQPNGHDTHYWFEWSKEPSLTEPGRSTSQDLGAGSSEVSVAHQLTGLSSDTTYYYRVVAEDSLGTRVEGEIESFTTSVGELRSLEAPALEGVADVGSELSASPGRWSPEATTAEDQWERCDALGEGCVPIEGATGNVYSPVEADTGHTLRVTEAVEDGEGVSGSIVSTTSKVINPFSMLLWPLSPPAISGIAAEGQMLIANHGEWSGESPFSYEYQWQRCDSGGASCADIEGASHSTYTLVEADVGGTLRLIVTATGGGAWDAAISEASAVVVKQTVTATSEPSITGTPAADGVLAAEHGTWTGVEAPTYSYQWLRCDAEGIDCEELEGQTEETLRLSQDDLSSTLRVIVTAHGAEDSGSAISAATEPVGETSPVNEARPSITGVAIEGQEMQAELGEWSGGNLSFAYQWESCNSSGAECEAIAGATEPTYTAAAEDVGRSLRVVVIASNELGSVDEVSDATATFAMKGTLVATSTPTVTGTPQIGATLTAEHGSWSGTGTISYAYRWQRCDMFGDSCATITGATSATYVPTEADLGDAVSVLVTASDTSGSIVARSAPSQPVAASGGPVASTTPTVSGSPEQGEALTATHGTFAGVESPSYAYKWVRCTAEDAGCASIPGASSSSYTLSAADLGEFLRVIVTATSGSGDAEAVSDSVGPISAPTLQNVSVPLLSGTAQAGQPLTATSGSWTGQGTITYAYQWQRCDVSGKGCSDIEEATGTEYSLVEADISNRVRVVITADGAWGSAKVPSDPTSVVTSAPSAPSSLAVPTIEGLDVEGQLLSAQEGSWGGAPPLSFAYQWNRCNGEGSECAPIPGATFVSYRLAPSDVGSTFSVSVTATNSIGEASADSSLTEAVGETETPVLLALPSISGTAQEEKLLTASVGEWSGPEPISYEYAWERCNGAGDECAPIEGASESTFTPFGEDVGHKLRLTITATNSSGSVLATSAETVAVKPAAPVAGGSPVVEGQPLVGATLSVDTSGEYSAETPTLSYQWQRCHAEEAECTNISGANAATYDPSESDVGFGIRTVVTFTNQTGEDVQTSSATEAVEAAGAPIEAEAPTISISSAGGLLWEILSGSPYARGDGSIVVAGTGRWYGVQPITYSYQWKGCISGECTNIPGADQATYIVPDDAEYDQVRVAVTATNTDGSSEAESFVNVAHNSSPYLETAPGISGELRVHSLLSVRPGEWLGGTPSSFSYQWERCGTSCTNISGATGASYLLTETDLGKEITLKVTATNRYGSTSTNVYSEGRVAGALPWNTVPPTVSGGTTAGERLTTSTGTWESVYSGYEYEWQVCDEAGEGCADISGASGPTHQSYTTTLAEVGHPIRVIVHGFNGNGQGTQASAPTAALTTPEAPTAGALPTISGTAEVGHTLTADEGEWGGGTPTSYIYRWERCDADGAECSVVPSITPQSSYALSEDDKFDTVRVTVTASNLAGSASATSQPTARVIGSSVPLDEAPPTIEGQTEMGAALAVVQGTWSGVEPISYAHRWERCNAEGHSCVAVTGIEGEAAYVLTEADEGYTIQVRESATNADGHTSAISELVGPITAPAAPFNEEAPVIEGSPEAGATLTASDGIWGGGATSSFSYQWQRCNGEGEECVNIAGEVTQAYEASMEDAGHTLRISVTAKNLGGEATASSAVSGAIEAPEVPSNLEAPTIEGTPAARETLSAGVGEWSGGPTVSFGYQWRRCDVEGAACTDISGATESAYEATSEDIGHTLRVVVTATNAAGSGSETSAASATVASASAPASIVAPRLPFGATPEFGVEIGVEAGAWTGHPSLAYQWERCDPLNLDPETELPSCVAIAEATEPLYAPSSEDVGYQLRVTETAANELGSTSQRTEMTAATVGYQFEESGIGYGGVAAVGQTITAEATLATNAALPASSEYEFLRLNSEGPPTELQSGMSPSYHVTGEDEGHTIEIRAVVSVLRADHEETLETRPLSTETSTVVGAIENTAPPTISGPPVVGSRLTSDHGSWSAGGEEAPFGWGYRWERCDEAGESCSPIAEATAEGYVPVRADEGHALRLRVSVGETSAVSAATEPIGPNAPPVLIASPSISGTPANGQRLTGSAGTWSSSGPVAYAYRWQSCRVDGTGCKPIASAEGSTYRLTEDDVGKSVRLQVVASSGTASATAVSEATAEVDALPAPVNETLPSTTMLGPEHVGAVIEAEGGEWKYVTPEALEYQWQRCSSSGGECQDIAGAQARSYEMIAADGGHRLRVVVQAANETGSTKAASSLSATIESVSEGDEEEASAMNHMVYAAEGALFIASHDGENAKAILTCSTADPNASAEGCVFSHPKISPDGQMVIVEEQPEPSEPEEEKRYGRILALNYDGSGLHVLAARGVEPDWGEGNTVIFTALGPGETPEMLSVEADGSNATDPTPITDEPGIGHEGDLSPNGNARVFVNGTGSGPGLFIGPTGTTEAVDLKITNEIGLIAEPKFTADEEHIVFLGKYSYDEKHKVLKPQREEQLYEVDVDGSGLHAITEWPSGLGFYTKSSPATTDEDGRTLLVGTKGGCPRFVSRGPGSTIASLDEQFHCETSALVEVRSGGSEEHVVAIGASVVSFWQPRKNLIPGAAPDGWCNEHLHGIGRAIINKSSLHEEKIWETSGEARGLHKYSVGLKIERNYDCEGGTSHIFWQPWYDTSNLDSTSILIAPSAERYDGTSGIGKSLVIAPKKGAPNHGLGLPPAEELRLAAKFPVRAAKRASRDPRIWRFSAAIVPDDSGNAYDVLAQLVKELWQGPNSRRLIFDQQYIRWLRPGCYPPAGTAAKAASCPRPSP